VEPTKCTLKERFVEDTPLPQEKSGSLAHVTPRLLDKVLRNQSGRLLDIPESALGWVHSMTLVADSHRNKTW
jgi:hypothetical protein